MPNCGGCGAETVRTRTCIAANGAITAEICPNCKPEDFSDAWRDPSDKKIYMGPEAFPKQYKRDANGIYAAKDELLQDTVDCWDKGPTASRIEEKRATRRTAPLTEGEKDKVMRWAHEFLEPMIHGN